LLLDVAEVRAYIPGVGNCTGPRCSGMSADLTVTGSQEVPYHSDGLSKYLGWGGIRFVSL